MSQIEQAAVRNRLLAALPPDAFAALAPILEPVELGPNQVLHEPGQAIRHVLFPEGGLVSHVLPLACPSSSAPSAPPPRPWSRWRGPPGASGRPS